MGVDIVMLVDQKAVDVVCAFCCRLLSQFVASMILTGEWIQLECGESIVLLDLRRNVLADAMIDGVCKCLNELRRKMDASAVLRPPPPILHPFRHSISLAALSSSDSSSEHKNNGLSCF